MSKLKVFYNPKQQVDDNESASPSAGKPKLVLESWLNKAPESIEVICSNACSFNTMMRAHSLNYLNDILNLKIYNGFGNKLKSVADSLPYSVGSFVDASIDAMTYGSVNASLTSGFHHAGYEFSGGFCTLNGLMVAAQSLKKQGLLVKGRVGILDLDQHYGNGTENIIKELKLDYVDHWTLGGFQNHFDYEVDYDPNLNRDEGKVVLDLLPKLFEDVFSKCDIILVQLGADACKDDPHGHTFTTDEMLERDRLVFKLIKQYNLPAVFNLAGGYQDPIRKVLDLHDFSLQAWIENFG